MAYNQEIPKPDDVMAASQSELLDNFQSIDTLFSINHNDLNSSVIGKHKQITFTERAVGDEPDVGVGNIALYTQEKTYNSYGTLAVITRPEVCIRSNNNENNFFFTEDNRLTANYPVIKFPSGIGLARFILSFATSPYTVTPEDIVDWDGNPVFSEFYALAGLYVESLLADSNAYVRIRSFRNDGITFERLRRDSHGPSPAVVQYIGEFLGRLA